MKKDDQERLDQERLDYLKARHVEQSKLITGCVYFAPLTEKEKQERDEQIAAGLLPF